MGLIASLEIVPAAVFKRHKRALEKLEVPAGASSFSLDKAWLQFHTTLRAMPKPLCLSISGDQAMGKLTEEKMLAAVKAAGWSLGTGGKKYYGAAFEELKKAYRAAAKKNDALQILIT